jgi:hypothetical protein
MEIIKHIESKKNCKSDKEWLKSEFLPQVIRELAKEYSLDELSSILSID